jgi:hypothetical protein
VFSRWTQILLHGNDLVAVSGTANTNLFLLNKVARGTLQKRDSAVFNVCLHRVFPRLAGNSFDQLTGDVSTLSRKRFLFRKEEEVRKEESTPAWSEAFRLNETHEFVIRNGRSEIASNPKETVSSRATHTRCWSVSVYVASWWDLN